jgi:ABC-type sugar transport system ATPase subunit
MASGPHVTALALASHEANGASRREPAPGRGAGILLRCAGLTKRFGAVRALRGVDFSIAAGRVRGLVGENGAGKSTLAKIIAGVNGPDSGTMEFEGRPIRATSADESLAQRIVTVHQDVNLIPSMSVMENLFLNNEPASRFGIIRRREARQTAKMLLDRYEIGVEAEAPVEGLSNDLRKMIQIVKAIHRDPKVLILDEPTSSLTSAQVSVVLRLIRQLASQGVGLVLISHYLGEIFEVCDDLTIMRDGEVVADRLVDEISLQEVVAAMVGREVSAGSRGARGRKPAEGAEPRLVVEGLTVRGVLENASFAIRAGEVLGVTGLTGSGLNELSRAIFGASARPATGRVAVDGQPVPSGSPSACLKAGLALLTDDRLREGVLLDFPLTENICLPVLSRFSGMLGALDGAAMERTAIRNIERLRIRTPGPQALARELSGGNQQKVLFAKWLETEPKVFVMDEPTIGVDVGAKDEIRKIIDEVAGRGVAVLLVTTELDELVSLCDRVMIMFRGAIVGELSGGAIERHTILHASTTGQIRAVAP